MAKQQGNEMLAPWASQIVLCGCIGALIGMATGGGLYLADIYFVYVPQQIAGHESPRQTTLNAMDYLDKTVPDWRERLERGENVTVHVHPQENPE